MDVDVVLMKVSVVSILVAKEETNAAIKLRQSILRRIVGEAVPQSMDKEIQVRYPILVIEEVGLSS